MHLNVFCLCLLPLWSNVIWWKGFGIWNPAELNDSKLWLWDWVFQSLCASCGIVEIISTKGEEMKACWIPMQAYFPFLCNANLLISCNFLRHIFCNYNSFTFFLDSTIIHPHLSNLSRVYLNFLGFLNYHFLHLSPWAQNSGWFCSIFHVNWHQY